MFGRPLSSFRRKKQHVLREKNWFSTPWINKRIKLILRKTKLMVPRTSIKYVQYEDFPTRSYSPEN